MQHTAVLPREVIAVLDPAPGDRVCDATLGLGGHAKLFLERIGPTGTLTGLDADRENLSHARTQLQPWAPQITLLNANFRDLNTLRLPLFDIIFADLGLSSPHIDDPARGFSFRADVPLDLRFDRSSGKTAAELLQTADEATLAAVFRSYGEFPGSKRLASALWRRMHKDHQPIGTTTDVRDLAQVLFGYRAESLLPQIFQALRIWTNDELGSLASLLSSAPTLLRPGGRLGIISYHSLEDRMTKRAMRALTTPRIDDRTGAVLEEPLFTLRTRKPIAPSDGEIAVNPRSRSAHFRVMRKS